MTQLFKSIAEARWFGNFITGVIVLASIVIGLETYPALVERYGDFLHALDKIILAIFAVEIAVKMGARWPRPLEYFRDPWNCFDFLIVAAALLPFDTHQLTVLRLLRLLRVLRLIRAAPRLQILVSALLKSLPSMGYVALLLMLLFYIYAVAGVFLFSKNDPVNFGALPQAFGTLFSVVTLEGWTNLMFIQMHGCDKWGLGSDYFQQFCTQPEAHPYTAPFYFVSFVLLGTMIFLNLMVGVIINGMEEAQTEREADERARNRVGDEPSVEDDLHGVAASVAALQKQLHDLQRRLAKHPIAAPSSYTASAALAAEERASGAAPSRAPRKPARRTKK